MSRWAIFNCWQTANVCMPEAFWPNFTFTSQLEVGCTIFSESVVEWTFPVWLCTYFIDDNGNDQYQHPHQQQYQHQQYSNATLSIQSQLRPRAQNSAYNTFNTQHTIREPQMHILIAKLCRNKSYSRYIGNIVIPIIAAEHTDTHKTVLQFLHYFSILCDQIKLIQNAGTQ